ncbi:MAG: Gfo/Idh/MocA family oxidoreductase [bacterium]|nr:Gfo/Idh/MocA family oxidoreductase [bacterium]
MSLKAAVIGVGAMGQHHARVYADLGNCELVAVADANADAGAAIGKKYGAMSYTNYQEMLATEKPDVVSIAVPTSLHIDIARTVIEAGCNLLIEKPIAATLEEGQQLINEAKAAGVKLMVGHIERFNPAVQQLKERLLNKELGQVRYIEARRQGPYPTRITDTGVVLDLAVHDLDIISFVTDAKIENVYAEIEACVGEHEDLLSSIVRLEGGIIGNININWITPVKIRELYVTGEAGTFHVNYLTQDLTFFENEEVKSSNWEAMGLWRGVNEGMMMKYKVQKEEPLKREIRSFVECITNDTEPPVSGADGLEALRLAQLMLESGKKHEKLNA